MLKAVLKTGLLGFALFGAQAAQQTALADITVGLTSGMKKYTEQLAENEVTLRTVHIEEPQMVDGKMQCIMPEMIFATVGYCGEKDFETLVNRVTRRLLIDANHNLGDHTIHIELEDISVPRHRVLLFRNCPARVEGRITVKDSNGNIIHDNKLGTALTSGGFGKEYAAYQFSSNVAINSVLPALMRFLSKGLDGYIPIEKMNGVRVVGAIPATCGHKFDRILKQ